jgi:GNAT superfamily N-acetyltransferase
MICNMTIRDAIFQKYFNQAEITLSVDDSVDVEEFDIANNKEMLAKIAGAPDGSKLQVSRGDGEAQLFNIVVSNNILKYPSVYALTNRGDGLGVGLYVDSVFLREEYQKKGIGPRSMLVSIYEAKAQGFKYVSLYAAGSAKDRSLYRGYHVWPLMGFDAALPTEILRELPEGLGHVRRLAELMLDDVGRQWWYHRGGRELDLEFDLSPGSLSWTLLENYVQAKGITYEY